MNKSQLRFLHRAVNIAVNHYTLGANTIGDTLTTIRPNNSQVYHIIQDVVSDARFYHFAEATQQWRDWAEQRVAEWIDGLQPAAFTDRDTYASSKERFLYDFFLSHIATTPPHHQAAANDSPVDTSSLSASLNPDGAKSPIGIDCTNPVDGDGSLSQDEIDALPNQLQNFAHGSGTGNDYWAEAEFMRSIDPSIVALAEQIGRSGDSVNSSAESRFPKSTRSDIVGVTVGNDLSALLPSELAMIGDPHTHSIFLQRFVQRRLQIFSSASSGPSKGKRHGGPIFMCIDTSGSMTGQPEVTAKTLALAIAIVAQRRRRTLCVINYSYSVSFFVLNCLQLQQREFMKFLARSYSGGNEENRLFNFVFNELPTLPRYRTMSRELEGADLLVISDFFWGSLEPSTLELLNRANQDGMQFYSLEITNDIHEGLQLDFGNDIASCSEAYLELCSHRHRFSNGRCIEITTHHKKHGK